MTCGYNARDALNKPRYTCIWWALQLQQPSWLLDRSAEEFLLLRFVNKVENCWETCNWNSYALEISSQVKVPIFIKWLCREFEIHLHWEWHIWVSRWCATFKQACSCVWNSTYEALVEYVEVIPEASQNKTPLFNWKWSQSSSSIVSIKFMLKMNVGIFSSPKLCNYT